MWKLGKPWQGDCSCLSDVNKYWALSKNYTKMTLNHSCCSRPFLLILSVERQLQKLTLFQSVFSQCNIPFYVEKLSNLCRSKKPPPYAYTVFHVHLYEGRGSASVPTWCCSLLKLPGSIALFGRFWSGLFNQQCLPQYKVCQRNHPPFCLQLIAVSSLKKK